LAVELTQLQAWIEGKEDEHLEFKEAKNSFQLEKLVDYCAALANEQGGRLVFGVTDRPPRAVVGSRAFLNLEEVKLTLVQKLRLRVEVDEVPHPDGRVLVFTVPTRPISFPIQVNGVYWMRSGESLVPMTPDQLKRIFDESGPDFSAEVCPRATMTDLHPDAIREFRALWRRKSGNEGLERQSDERLLADAELVVDGGVTYAALILLGTRAALGRYLGQAEVIFEYRSGEASIAYQRREEFREGFLLFRDRLWELINLRNDRQSFQDGLVRREIPTFNELAVREAILNAVSHRDFRLAGSVFVRQYPRKLVLVSPGGFPAGISPDNILWRQAPRNRRPAEAFAKCGLIERSGQGIDRMFEEAIKESKPRPDFAGSDDYQVSVTLGGEVQHPEFLRFLEQVGSERLASFSTEDFLVLDRIYRKEPVAEDLKPRLEHLLDMGVIERAGGKGKTARYVLSRRFYDFLGQKGVYTREVGLDREANKALLLKHIRENPGSRFKELCQVLPHLSEDQVQRLLRDLKAEGHVHNVGRTSAAKWFLGEEKPG
jgi:ATP-dependent DNA helicase RecG